MHLEITTIDSIAMVFSVYHISPWEDMAKSKDILKLKNSPETNVSNMQSKGKAKIILKQKWKYNITKFIGCSKSSIQRKDHSNKMPILRKKKDSNFMVVNLW